MDWPRESLLEEFVQYEVYPDPHIIDKAQKDSQDDYIGFLVTYLDYLRVSIMQVVDSLSKDYLWHAEKFNLNVCVNKCSQTMQPGFLGGTVEIDGCLEDEWFITYLLIEVSKACPNVVIRIFDSDGEFLLIQAAEHLPEWLEPDQSANRVFIYNGDIHIIDINDLCSPNIQESINFVRTNPQATLATMEIQEAIKHPVDNFRRLGQLRHSTRVVLPKKLALAIQLQPSIISPILRALFNRAPSWVSKASLLRNIRTIDGSLEFVSTKISFTRNQFAQLLCQQIFPPKCYPIPSEKSNEYLAHVLGFKLALGAEIVLLNDKDESSDTITKNYEHSFDKYEEVAKLAKKCFEGIAVKDEPITHNLRKLLTMSTERSIETYFGPDDDTSWLDIDGGTIINELESKLKQIQLSSFEQDEVVNAMIREEDGDNDTDDAPTLLNRRLDHFLNRHSGIEGVEYTNDECESGDSSEFDESDEELLTHEILETILHDPDLLMKILEKTRHCDPGDISAFLQLIKDKKATLSVTDKRSGSRNGVKKGISDIDPAKLAAIRSKSYSVDNESIIHNEGQLQKGSPDHEIDDLIHNEDQKPRNEYPEEIGESVSDPDMQSYINSMDAELNHCMVDRSVLNHGDFENAVKADKSPAHTILLSIQR